MTLPAIAAARRLRVADIPTDLRIVAGIVGLAAALAIRVEVAGVSGSRSIVAGVVFGALVAALAWATARRPIVPARARRWAVLRDLALGLAGAAALCVPAALRHADGLAPTLPVHGYAPWAAAVTLVAVAEESLLRGSLFTAVRQRAGTTTAIAVTSVAFALMHVPLYGSHVLVLDLAVGVWLGALRAVTGSVTVPAVAHSAADLLGWWLR